MPPGLSYHGFCTFVASSIAPSPTSNSTVLIFIEGHVLALYVLAYPFF